MKESRIDDRKNPHPDMQMIHVQSSTQCKKLFLEMQLNCAWINNGVRIQHINI